MSVKICAGRGISELLKAQVMQDEDCNLSVIQAKPRGRQGK